eukprot:scaffold7167_cov165-Amphora_coffeaeformis.AAC.3
MRQRKLDPSYSFLGGIGKSNHGIVTDATREKPDYTSGTSTIVKEMSFEISSVICYRVTLTTRINSVPNSPKVISSPVQRGPNGGTLVELAADAKTCSRVALGGRLRGW